MKKFLRDLKDLFRFCFTGEINVPIPAETLEKLLPKCFHCGVGYLIYTKTDIETYPPQHILKCAHCEVEALVGYR